MYENFVQGELASSGFYWTKVMTFVNSIRTGLYRTLPGPGPNRVKATKILSDIVLSDKVPTQ